jgi:hypothetical protein
LGARGADGDHEHKDIVVRARTTLINNISTRDGERLGTETKIRHNVVDGATRNSTTVTAPTMREVVGTSQDMSQQGGRAGCFYAGAFG